MQNPNTLPYRPCAGIMLLNAEGLVWLGKRIPKKHDKTNQIYWQMPQGGIDEGENPQEAALRELQEETGITSVEIIAETPDWLTYDLPEELLGVALKGKYRGQKQKWFAMRFVGSEDEINITPEDGEKPEFEAWEWRSAQDITALTVPFKQDVYKNLLKIFDDIL